MYENIALTQSPPKNYDSASRLAGDLWGSFCADRKKGAEAFWLTGQFQANKWAMYFETAGVYPMPRPPRADAAGEFYHVLNRGETGSVAWLFHLTQSRDCLTGSIELIGS